LSWKAAAAGGPTLLLLPEPPFELLPTPLELFGELALIFASGLSLSAGS